MGFCNIRGSLKKNIRTCNQFQLSNWYCYCFRSYRNLGLFKKSFRFWTESKTGLKRIRLINVRVKSSTTVKFVLVDRFNGRNFWIRFCTCQRNKENWFPSRWSSRTCSPRIGLFRPLTKLGSRTEIHGPDWTANNPLKENIMMRISSLGGIRTRVIGSLFICLKDIQKITNRWSSKILLSAIWTNADLDLMKLESAQLRLNMGHGVEAKLVNQKVIPVKRTHFRFELPVFSISWCNRSNYWWQTHRMSWYWNASKLC